MSKSSVPRQGRVMAGDGYVLVNHTGAITTSGTGEYFQRLGIPRKVLDEVRGGKKVQTVHGLLFWKD